MENWDDARLDDLAKGVLMLMDEMHRMNGRVDGLQLVISHVLASTPEETKTELLTALSLVETVSPGKPRPYYEGVELAMQLGQPTQASKPPRRS